MCRGDYVFERVDAIGNGDGDGGDCVVSGIKSESFVCVCVCRRGREGRGRMRWKDSEIMKLTDELHGFCDIVDNVVSWIIRVVIQWHVEDASSDKDTSVAWAGVSCAANIALRVVSHSVDRLGDSLGRSLEGEFVLGSDIGGTIWFAKFMDSQ